MNRIQPVARVKADSNCRWNSPPKTQFQADYEGGDHHHHHHHEGDDIKFTFKEDPKEKDSNRN